MEEKSSHTPKTAMEEKKVVHNFNSSQSLFSRGAVIFYIVLVLLGIGTGYVVASKHPEITSSSTTSSSSGASSSPKSGQTYGSTDSSFKDTAEGVLQAGGIDGEGAYHLVRPGGDSQNVYMTSSTVDLSKFVGKKIKVWGQTQASQKAGWLMDVGRVEVD